ncbi:MAG: hypothetical protein HQK52_01655 [Oligoflexia bacterium]|nr:hypothetical protein [Oligoflexia bacterium]
MIKLLSKKYLFFYTLFFLSSFALILLLILAADLFMHQHLSKQLGYNYKGYRGKVLSAKDQKEWRVACFGASTVYGYFVGPTESWPALLEKQFKMIDKFVSVANLGWNNQGIYGVFQDLQYYENLNYNIAILYNSNADPDPKAIDFLDYRGANFFFRTFGYMPILPLYLSEKTKILKYGVENLDKAYLGQMDDQEAKKTNPVRFRVGMALDEVHGLFSQITDKVNHYEKEARKIQDANQKPYAEYLSYLSRSFDWLIARHKIVLYISNPGSPNRIKQELVEAMIKEQYSDRVFYLDLSLAVDVKDKSLCLDGMHLSPNGNEIVAAKIKNFILEHNLINKHSLGGE